MRPDPGATTGVVVGTIIEVGLGVGPGVGIGVAVGTGVGEGSGRSVGGGIGVGLVAAVGKVTGGTYGGIVLGLGSTSAWMQPSSSRGTAASQIIMEACTPFPLTWRWSRRGIIVSRNPSRMQVNEQSPAKG